MTTKKSVELTPYEAWRLQLHGYGNRGSFVSALFHAYERADGFNEKRLQRAYPEYFVNKSVNTYLDINTEEDL